MQLRIVERLEVIPALPAKRATAGLRPATGVASWLDLRQYSRIVGVDGGAGELHAGFGDQTLFMHADRRAARQEQAR